MRTSVHCPRRAQAAGRARAVGLLGAVAGLGLAMPVMAEAQTGANVAFVGVNVVPMDAERVLEDHTVVVEGDMIVSVGPTGEVPVPPNAQIIDAQGAYLLPGLADMHAHLNVDPSPDFMRLFLAEGTTTVRNLNALPEHLAWRNEVLRGERVGPTIYTSGPVIGGPPDPSIVWVFRVLIVGGFLVVGGALWLLLWVFGRSDRSADQVQRLRRMTLPGAAVLVSLASIVVWVKVIPLNVFASRQLPMAYIADTEERARAEVRRQVEAGYDLIKLYDWMKREEYLGAIDEAQAQGIYVIAHLDHGIEAPFAAGLREAAHVDEFLDEHLMGEISPRAFKSIPLNHETIPESIAAVVRHDGLVVSNMSTDVITYEYLKEGPSYFRRPEYHRIRPETIKRWLQGRMVNWQGQEEWRRFVVQPFLEEVTIGLHRAGVPILTGTDTGVEGGLPSHIHRELELLVAAGFSPYEALVCATRNARLSVNRMGIDDAFGEVATGHRADLLLIEANPLENIGATRRRLGVMSRGRWYTQEDLDRLVAEFTTTY